MSSQPARNPDPDDKVSEDETSNDVYDCVSSAESTSNICLLENEKPSNYRLRCVVQCATTQSNVLLILICALNDGAQDGLQECVEQVPH